MGLFKPSWKSIDPEKRRKAVEALTDQEKLKQVAAQDPELGVRYAALRRITDEMFLAAYAAQIGHRGLQNEAIRQIKSWPVLVQLAAACPKDNSLCIDCFERIPAQIPREALALLYRAGGWAALHAAVRMKDVAELTELQRGFDQTVAYRAKTELAAIEKERQLNSDDPAALRRLLQGSDDADVVLNAADKLQDEALVFQRLKKEAGGKLGDRQWLLVKRLAGKLTDPGYIKRLFALGNESFLHCISESALKRMQEIEPAFVEEIARSEKFDRYVRADAVELLTDPELLTEIGLKEPELRYYVMSNPHFPNDQRVFAAVLADPEASELHVEIAAKGCSDPARIMERLVVEKKGKLIGVLSSCLPALKPYADDLVKVLSSRPKSGVDYQKRTPSPTVTANLRRDADAVIAAWTEAAKRLIALAETQPEVLLPLWDRLDSAITGAEAEIRFHRYLSTGSSEWDDAAQDFKFSYDEQEWTEKTPLALTFPPRPAE